MQFYIAWVDQDEPFDPDQHNRLDEDVFRLVIKEHEGLFPRASVSIRNPKRGFLSSSQKQWVYLSCHTGQDVKLLFKGRLVTIPVALKGELMTLELIAEPTDAEERIKRASQALQQLPYFDPLFLSPERALDPEPHELLDARDDLFYWSRTTHAVSLSNIFQGKQTLTLGDKFIYDSLDLKVIDSPLAEVQVELIAQWRQRITGETRLDHIIQAKLPNGLISTLTGPDLEARWWSEGKGIGRTGYHIVESQLQKVETAKSNPIMVSAEELKSSLPQQVRLKRNLYRPKLKVQWRYCQKRVERVFFTLKNNVQTLGYNTNRKRTLRIHLQNFTMERRTVAWLADHIHVRGDKIVQDHRLYQCLRTHRASDNFNADQENWRDLGPYQEGAMAESRGTFFSTDRGVQAFEHALEIARSHLASSTRAVEVKFCCALLDALALTCDHNVVLNDPRLPGQRVEGKVTKLSFEVDGKTGLCCAYVSLACSLGKAQRPQQPVSSLEVYGDDCFEDAVVSQGDYRQTISGLYYQPFYDQLPDRGHVFPAFLGASDILRGVEILNDAAGQEDYLKQHQYPRSHSLKDNLRQVKTAVKLWLEDLRSVDVLEHHIHINVPTPWSGPKHIDLAAE